MAILDGSDIVYVDRCRSSRAGQRAIDLNLHVGSRLPAYCTSLGKVLLAFTPAERRDAVLAARGSPARPEHAHVTHRARGGARLVRARGLAINNEELAYGLRSIAAPVLAHDGAWRPRSTSPSTAR